jgi:hypothetical protein
MTIENLTIKEAKQKLEEYKELQTLFNFEPEELTEPKKSNLFDRYIGKYVICRSRNEGVNAGYVVELDETGVILKEARRLYYHKPVNKNVSWYEGVAKYGLSDRSKTSTSIEKIIIEDYSLTVCTAEAEKSIKEAKDHEQTD